MFSLLSENDAVAVATAPLTAQTVKPKFQPLAGLTAATTEPRAQVNVPAPVPAPLVLPVAAPQQNIRSTVFTSEGRPDSPWAKGAARTSPVPAPHSRHAVGRPAGLPEAEDGIEGVRQLLFGRQMGEVQTKVAELQLSLNGDMKRLREALMSRVDEMSGYLHRDMVVLRDEMHREMGQLKTDLFTAATALSSVKDRLMTVETQSREETVAALADIECRMARQESAFTMALENIETKLSGTFDSKCAESLAVLAKKSEMADLLSQMGTLVAQETPGVDLGWFSAAPGTETKPVVEAKPAAGGGETWAALANGVPVDGTANDWGAPVNPFMPDESLIT